jgi:D-alanyl-D-alanine carboxypeptidase
MGRAPSSFAQQVRQMNNTAQLRPGQPAYSREKSIQVALSARQEHSGVATHQVQIGAFFTDDDARRALLQTQKKAQDILRGAQPVSIKVDAQPRPIFRARFAGFDAAGALKVCSRLKDVRVDCFVTRQN